MCSRASPIILSLGRGLLLAFIFGRLYPDEDLIPSMMFSRSRGTPTGKGAVQQIEIRNRVHQRPSPVRERLTAHTSDLIAEKFDGTVMNAIIMRLNDSWLILISNLLGGYQSHLPASRRFSSSGQITCSFMRTDHMLATGYLGRLVLVCQSVRFYSHVIGPVSTDLACCS